MLAALVTAESPSENALLMEQALSVTARLGAALLGLEPERVQTQDRMALRWRFGTPRILLLAHLDTVWPEGTIERWPFAIEGTRATGPGVFDMKGGLVQGLFAIAELPDRSGIELLVTTDEEIGSPYSKDLVQASAKATAATLVLEPSLDGALKTARKGAGEYVVTIRGRSAHAGLDPDSGVNATSELAHQVQAIDRLSDVAVGTRVIPTCVRSGEVSNQIPALATISVDVRAEDDAELRRVDSGMRGLEAVVPGATISVTGGIMCSPMGGPGPQSLFRVAAATWAELGLGALASASAGGTSDANHASAVGVPTLDGLGAVGGNAHAEGEWLDLDAMPERAALLAGMVSALRDDRRSRSGD